MHISPSQKIYDAINDWSRIEQFISSGETEGLYYECKSPLEPKFNKDMRVHLAKACSGFGNTNGGMIIYGISTTKHSHSGLDVMSQIEPMGNIAIFEKQIESEILSLSTPIIKKFQTKIIKKSVEDSRGCLIVHIPQVDGDPVQSNIDNIFYYRSGDDFVVAPYEMIRRFFSSATGPNLEVIKTAVTVSRNLITVPIAIRNLSYAIAEHSKCIILIKNTNGCDVRFTKGSDISKINTEFEKSFIVQINDVMYKGITMQLGDILATNSTEYITFPFSLTIEVRLYSNKMVNKRFQCDVSSNDLRNAEINIIELPDD